MLVVVTAVLLIAGQQTLGQVTSRRHDRHPLLKPREPDPNSGYAPEFGIRIKTTTTNRPTPPSRAENPNTEGQLSSTESYDTSLPSVGELLGPKLTDELRKDCFKLSYNSTNYTYSSTVDYNFDIWFKSLSPKATIQLNFDFSVSALGVFTSPGEFTYTITSERWHRLQVFRNKLSKDCETVQLLIAGVADECLPHKTPSLLQVSSGDEHSLILWNNCAENSLWWNEVTKEQPMPMASSPSGLYQWLSIALIAIVIILSIYVCCLHFQLKKERSDETKKESIYAEWNDTRSISNGSDKCTVKTSLSSEYQSRFP
ncbi:uncharacterized protein [Palaemon carinicauda]|uniref:uncharacterized protein n=1 Tax=Palaemon carinicauda TaxID=392227 RepID=UPI0035B69BBE